MAYFEKPQGYWNNKDRCYAEALKFTTRRKFEKGSNGAYDSAFKNGWLDDICSHMPKPGDSDYARLKNGRAVNFKWDTYSYTTEALKYETIGDFRKQSRGAYNAANRNGDLQKICSHMQRTKTVDVVYAWNTVEHPDIWKIGVSNIVRVEKRIRTVISQTDLTLHEVFWLQYNDSFSLESQLLGIGIPHTLIGIVDGKSEIRFMNEEDVKKMKTLLEMSGSLQYGFHTNPDPIFDSLFEE